ncbi:MAG: polyprenyl synthetase family protein [Marinilabiliales bacterium]
MFQYDYLKNLINDKINQINFDKSPYELYQPIKYILSIGGKRLRPVLTLMACNIFSDDINNAVNPAIGLEVFHNFTLIHDDIMDNAPIRRNMPSVHEKWNLNTAVLSGDAMMIFAYNFFFDLPDNYFKSVIKVFNKTALEVCEGQQFDMNFEEKLNISEDQYMEMIRLKTSVLISTALKIGGIIGGANDTNLDLLYNTGKYAGLAFQLQDDLLDSYGKVEEFGKSIGNDIVTNKKTYLLIKTIELANSKDKDTIFNWLNKKEFDKNEKITTFLSFYNKYNIYEHTINKINELNNFALESLTKIKVNESRKLELEKLIKKLIKRKY